MTVDMVRRSGQDLETSFKHRHKQLVQVQIHLSLELGLTVESCILTKGLAASVLKVKLQTEFEPWTFSPLGQGGLQSSSTFLSQYFPLWYASHAYRHLFCQFMGEGRIFCSCCLSQDHVFPLAYLFFIRGRCVYEVVLKIVIWVPSLGDFKTLPN